jgi:SAM-dependent methyltransferase
MFRVDTDKDWEKFGSTDPYYGVFSSDRFKTANVDDAAKADFFASGETHIARCLAILRKTFDYVPKGVALDFGCGTGRLTNALAPHFAEVVGVDVSAGMLAEARTESAKRGLGNIAYVIGSDETWSARRYGFVHSFIVFQHIPVVRGEAILKSMIAALEDGGVGALHLTYGDSETPLRSTLRRVAKEFVPLRALANLARGKRWNEPSMQMNTYSLPRIFQTLGEAGIETVFVHRVDDYGNLGAFLFFQKRGARRSASPWSTPRGA